MGPDIVRTNIPLIVVTISLCVALFVVFKEIKTAKIQIAQCIEYQQAHHQPVPRSPVDQFLFAPPECFPKEEETTLLAQPEIKLEEITGEEEITQEEITQEEMPPPRKKTNRKASALKSKE
jgi:hypothetical protein